MEGGISLRNFLRKSRGGGVSSPLRFGVCPGEKLLNNFLILLGMGWGGKREEKWRFFPGRCLREGRPVRRTFTEEETEKRVRGELLDAGFA